MTPVRAPAIVRGDVPGLLRRGMPVRFLRSERAWHGPTGVVTEVFDGAVTALVTSHGGEADGNGEVRTRGIAIDYTDPAALYLSLHWLADRGHLCGWMLPTTHGGRVEAWDGLTAWEVAAVLVSHEVALRAAGRPGITDIDRAYSIPTNARLSMDRIGRADVYWTATEADRDHFLAPTRLGHDSRATPDHPGWLYTPRLGFTSYGLEVGAEAVAKINECALMDGCCLQVPGGLVVPT